MGRPYGYDEGYQDGYEAGQAELVAERDALTNALKAALLRERDYAIEAIDLTVERDALKYVGIRADKRIATLEAQRDALESKT